MASEDSHNFRSAVSLGGGAVCACRSSARPFGDVADQVRPSLNCLRGSQFWECRDQPALCETG